MRRATSVGRMLFAVISVLAIACGSSRPRVNVSQALHAYCAGIASGGIFMAVCPPQQGILPNALLELHLSEGWRTSTSQCIPFTTIRTGDTGDVLLEEAGLPDVNADVNMSGDLDLGVASLNVGASAAGSLVRQVRLAFEDVRTMRSEHGFFDPIAITPNGRYFDERVYPLEKYRDKRGSDKKHPYSLFFYRVERIYLTSRIKYLIARSSIGGVGGDYERLANVLTANTHLKWETSEDGAFADRVYQKPVAIAIDGTLYEINSRDGRLIRFQRFPLVTQ